MDPDWPDDPAVDRILLRYREEVAQATERAYRELTALGFDPDGPSREPFRPPFGPLTPPVAGQWIRLEYRAGPATRCWHLFSGDLAWRPAWFGARLETVCGYRTPVSADELRTTDDPDVPCRRCLRSVQG